MATAFVITCIDPRFISVAMDLLNREKNLHQDFDLFVLAGSELGCLTKPTWNETAMEHIDIAKKLHNITKIICISHMDCGFYKAHYNIKKDDNPFVHVDNQIRLKEFFKLYYPDLSYVSYILTNRDEFVKTA